MMFFWTFTLTPTVIVIALLIQATFFIVKIAFTFA